jgi:hypothetical protein
MNSHFAFDEQLPADCASWRHFNHIVRLQNALTLAYLTLRDERELGIPLTADIAQARGVGALGIVLLRDQPGRRAQPPAADLGKILKKLWQKPGSPDQIAAPRKSTVQCHEQAHAWQQTASRVRL